MEVLLLLLSLMGMMIGWLGCSTQEVKPQVALPQVPQYLYVLHPAGLDLNDVRAIFKSPRAPSEGQLQGCDSDFQKLRTLTNSKEEINQGAREFVMTQPEKYHWCFYWNILELQAELSKDTRYLRWAVKNYKDLSTWIFYRRVELTPEATADLLENIRNPYALWRKDTKRKPILEKYHLLEQDREPATAPISK